MKRLMVAAMVAGASCWIVFAQDEGAGRGPRPTSGNAMRASAILRTVDADDDGVISAGELTNAPARVRTLDANGDGKIVPAEAGFEGAGRGRGGRGRDGGGPASGPSVDDLVSTLMAFDANHDGKLAKTEVPARLQGLFERGDNDHDSVLSDTELRALAAAQAGPSRPEEGGRGRDAGPGRGFSPFDVAAAVLDVDRDGALSSSEVDRAAEALRALDRNGDGRITADEVRPAFDGPGGRFGGRGGDPRGGAR